MLTLHTDNTVLDNTKSTYAMQYFQDNSISFVFPSFITSCYEHENPVTKHSFTFVANSKTAHLNFSRENKRLSSILT